MSVFSFFSSLKSVMAQVRNKLFKLIQIDASDNLLNLKVCLNNKTPRIKLENIFSKINPPRKILCSYYSNYSVIIRPKKINYMFLRHRPRHFQPPRIKNFYCIFSIHIEKSSIHRELSV